MATPSKTAQTPQRSLDQRLDALRRANEIRSLRAQLKKELKSGALSVEKVISEPKDFVLTAKVFDIIVPAPNSGKVQATRWLNQCRISQGKTVGGPSRGQRDELVDLLKQR